MSQPVRIFRNGPIFDGQQIHQGAYAAFEGERFVGLGPEAEAPKSDESTDLNNDILSVGYVDLQVNGGGGVMFNADPSLAVLQRMAEAHRSLGVVKLLPTLISDTREKTRAAIAAAKAAIAASQPGIIGLHLEGPHLSVARKGAHDATLIRAMDDADLNDLLQAAQDLPLLKVTIAPESVSEDQVAQLSKAGVLVSLGHSDADFETCQRYFAAGARCATHLFNAMSQIGNRAPGLAGAAISTGDVSAGLIADGVHVHPEVMRMAWQAKQGPGRIFLVSDAMAVAGSTLTHFELGGRRIERSNGQLRLADGTLAGADLDLTTAVSVLVHKVGVPLKDALAAATRVPAALCGLALPDLAVTSLQDVIRIRADLSGTVPIENRSTQPTA